MRKLRIIRNEDSVREDQLGSIDQINNFYRTYKHLFAFFMLAKVLVLDVVNQPVGLLNMYSDTDIFVGFS